MDAILYVTQYIYSVDPARFMGDPAFDFGNQTSMGFFSPILGTFIESFGISVGAFAYTLLMQIFWVVAFVFFVKNLLWLNRQRLWTMPVVILLTSVFSNGMPFSHIAWFHYLSSYACSRSLSIALGMIGVALLFGKRRYLSLSIILVGTVIHPLTSGWCLPLWMFFFFPKTKIPIVVLSFLFPFSCLFHLGFFDTYPADWLAKPLMRPGYELLSIYIFLFVFFLLLVKFSRNQQIRKISVALCILIAITFYWDLWGGIGEHILLYQVQPWRALWLPSLVAAPLGVCLVKDSFRECVKRGVVSTRNLGTVLLVSSILVPIHLFFVVLVSVVFLLIKERRIGAKEFALTYGGFLLGGYLVQQYLLWCLRDFPAFYTFSILELYRIRDSFLVYQFIFTIGFVFFFLKKRFFVSSLLLILSVFFSRFMLMPLLAFFLYFFPKGNKFKYWSLAFLVAILIIFDGVFDADLRNHFLMQSLPLSLLMTSAMSVLIFFSIYLSTKIFFKGILMCFLVSCLFSAIGYGIYAATVLKKEKPLDQYLNKSIFPQLEERGRVFFYVSGKHLVNPRLQFMTGSYFNEVSRVGSVFFKEHYREALERSHLLYWKKKAPKSSEFFEYAVILAKIADADTLVDRVGFLCEMKEIHHIVSDKMYLPFVKEDSTIILNSQKVYLYACPSER